MRRIGDAIFDTIPEPWLDAAWFRVGVLGLGLGGLVGAAVHGVFALLGLS